MSNLDIRWKQRFAHYKKAFALLEQTMTIELLRTPNVQGYPVL